MSAIAPIADVSLRRSEPPLRARIRHFAARKNSELFRTNRQWRSLLSALKPKSKRNKNARGGRNMTAGIIVQSNGTASRSARWGYLAICVICMVMIANLQYGWTLFVNPMQQGARLVDRFDPGRLRDLHRARNLADAGRGLDRRRARSAARPEAHGRLRRHMRRHRLGHQCLCRFAGDALSRRRHLRHRRRRDLRDLRRHGGEMVPRPARTGGRPDRGRLRRRRGADRDPDPLRDRNYGYAALFSGSASCQGAVVFVLAWMLRGPEPGEMAGAAASKVAQSARSFSPKEVLMPPVFWLLYIMFVMVSAAAA